MQLLRRWGRGDEVWGSIPAPPTRCVLKQVVQMVIAFPFGALVLPTGQNQRTKRECDYHLDNLLQHASRWGAGMDPHTSSPRPQRRNNCIGYILRPCCAAEIGRANVAGKRCIDRGSDARGPGQILIARRPALGRIFQQHCCAADRRQWIGHALAGNIGR